ncbi:unnamed protein product, partial [Darwinula stevensoni]
MASSKPTPKKTKMSPIKPPDSTSKHKSESPQKPEMKRIAKKPVLKKPVSNKIQSPLKGEANVSTGKKNDSETSPQTKAIVKKHDKLKSLRSKKRLKQPAPVSRPKGSSGVSERLGKGLPAVQKKSNMSALPSVNPTALKHGESMENRRKIMPMKYDQRILKEIVRNPETARAKSLAVSLLQKHREYLSKQLNRARFHVSEEAKEVQAPVQEVGLQDLPEDILTSVKMMLADSGAQEDEVKAAMFLEIQDTSTGHGGVRNVTASVEQPVSGSSSVHEQRFSSKPFQWHRVETSIVDVPRSSIGKNVDSETLHVPGFVSSGSSSGVTESSSGEEALHKTDSLGKTDGSCAATGVFHIRHPRELYDPVASTSTSVPVPVESQPFVSDFCVLESENRTVSNVSTSPKQHSPDLPQSASPPACTNSAKEALPIVDQIAQMRVVQNSAISMPSITVPSQAISPSKATGSSIFCSLEQQQQRRKFLSQAKIWKPNQEYRPNQYKRGLFSQKYHSSKHQVELTLRRQHLDIHRKLTAIADMGAEELRDPRNLAEVLHLSLEEDKLCGDVEELDQEIWKLMQQRSRVMEQIARIRNVRIETLRAILGLPNCLSANPECESAGRTFSVSLSSSEQNQSLINAGTSCESFSGELQSSEVSRAPVRTDANISPTSVCSYVCHGDLDSHSHTARFVMSGKAKPSTVSTVKSVSSIHIDNSGGGSEVIVIQDPSTNINLDSLTVPRHHSSDNVNSNSTSLEKLPQSAYVKSSDNTTPASRILEGEGSQPSRKESEHESPELPKSKKRKFFPNLATSGKRRRSGSLSEPELPNLPIISLQNVQQQDWVRDYTGRVGSVHVSNDEQVFPLHSQKITGMKLFRRRIFTVSDDQSLNVFHTRTLSLVCRFPGHHYYPITCLDVCDLNTYQLLKHSNQSSDPGEFKGELVMSACKGGIIKFFHCYTSGKGVAICEKSLGTEILCMEKGKGFIYLGVQDGTLLFLNPRQMDVQRRILTTEGRNSPILFLKHHDHFIYVGNAHGLQIRDQADGMFPYLYS